MNRGARAAMAAETLEIIERGRYRSAGGREVDIGASIRECLEGTRYLTPEAMEAIRDAVAAQPGGTGAARLEVVNETTLAGLTRLLEDGGGAVGVLNFASARNPGGGFLGGSQAQEESLARSSALYASLQRVPEFYARHSAPGLPLYSDSMVWSPDCPVFRDDAGSLLDRPLLASFITSPAPNAGAAAQNQPEQVARIPAVLRHRAELVLALAASRGMRRLVLGAWGCGVFRNDPVMVAEVFRDHLRDGPWSGRFDRVRFSVLDTSASGETLEAFRSALG